MGYLPDGESDNYSSDWDLYARIRIMAIQSMTSYEYFVPESFSLLVNQIGKLTTLSEPGVVISAPYNGMERRVKQIIDNEATQFPHPLIYVNATKINNIEEFLFEVSSLGFRVGVDPVIIFVINSNAWHWCQNFEIFSELHEIQSRSKGFKVVYFFETNIWSEESKKFSYQAHLWSEPVYYPLHDELDSQRFIHYLTKKWRLLKLSKRIVRQIVHQCKGHLWLLKQALAEYTLNNHIEFARLSELPAMRYRLDLLKAAFTCEEIRLLTGSGDKNTSAHEHLTKLGLLSNDSCTIPLLKSFISRSLGTKKLIVKEETILYQDMVLNQMFSNLEQQVLRLLIHHTGKYVTKDQIADVVWGKDADEMYSVWAIEQLMKRIRVKLAKLGFLQSYIKTKRGLGYGIET